MKALLIGASGQIGSELAKFLPSKAIEVTGVSRSGNSPAKKTIKFDPFKDDWTVLGKFDIVINAAGIIAEKGDQTFEKVHIGITKKIIENRSLLGEPKIIQISVLGADEASNAAFLNTKAAADKLLLAQKNTFVIRPSIICSHDTMMVKKIRMIKHLTRLSFNHLPFPEKILKTKIQPILVEDLCEFVSCLCYGQPDKNLFELTGPDQMAMKSIFKIAIPDGKFINVSIGFVNFIVKLFPFLMSPAQLDLLMDDNISSQNDFEKITGKRPSKTFVFWKKELQ
jgi:uncharacterized protein YbjT (DUF2867 family)